jgi:ubiquinone/menaquinone biosynthesis C-methylase UbiE
MDYYEPPKVEHVQYVESIRGDIRDTYGKVAEANNKGQSCGNARSCCGVPSSTDPAYCMELGYSAEDLKNAPEGSNMGLGCGNPSAIAGLKAGEYVLDLGSGGGFDAFLAAQKVGASGKVFGVDMTSEMISKSRANAQSNGYANVEFLLGEIEHIPLPDHSVDVIISNCVINLSVDKPQVFKEAFRVLKGGGRLAISDIVANQPLPPEITNSSQLHCACIAGAMTIDELKSILQKAGFVDIVIDTQASSKTYIKDWAPEVSAENYVISAKITAKKI